MNFCYIFSYIYKIMDLLKFIKIYYVKFLCSSHFTYFCKVSAQGALVNS